MDYGKLEYFLVDGASEGGKPGRLRLTLVGQGDEEVLRLKGLAELRRRRIIRLTGEAEMQGRLLCYDDLAGLLLTSLATLKRDVGRLEASGHRIPLKGRRKNGNGNGGNGGNNGG